MRGLTSAAARFMGRAKVLTALLALVSVQAVCAPQIAWLARFDNGITNRTHKPVAMALDSMGNILVAGSSLNTQSNLDYVVLKYTPNGSQLWAARYDSGGGTNDQVRAMTVDQDGNGYVTGTSVTVKYNANGSQAWVAPHAGRALAVDTNGNVFVTGFSETDFATAKLNSSGSNLWLRTHDRIGRTDISEAIALDTQGNVLVAGTEQWAYDQFGGYPRFALIKYSSAGTKLWDTNFPYGFFSSLGTEVRGLALDSAGNAFLTGNLRGGGGGVYYVAKVSPTGMFQWETALVHSQYEGVTAMALAPNGNIYLTGRRIMNFPNVVYQTYKLDTSGSNKWAAAYFGPTSGYHKANAIAVDTNGNVYVTGQSTGVGTGQDWVTIKYDSSGNQLWAQRYDGPAHGNDEAVAIAVDNAGGVYVTGYQTVPGGGTEIVTIKYAEIQNIQRQTNCTIRLQFFAPAGQSYSFQVSSNLTAWEPLATVLADSNGIATFDDTNAVLFPQRFYRGVSP